MNASQAELLAVFFAAGKPLSELELARGLERSEEEIRRLVAELARTLEDGGLGVALEEVAGGWRLIVHPRHVDRVQRVLRPRPPRLSPAALEVLAIVAYHQPITRPEIETMRGKSSDAVLEGLLERGLVEVVGQKPVVGRPRLFGTTQRFLELFGLGSLEDLPPLDEGPALLLRD
ncbi:MAG TPA: SMC-Scp complex subunit ScpB [Oceanithermus profundus]|uniref:SMC-Scp complex subunit ScpB n=1 Tax=Oceanithermus profundus TaxID=187137 RepID=A0A7C4V523_9DEIN|nr:SMC-Scp complex subunit ScpB [Oceanithermus profundus]